MTIWPTISRIQTSRKFRCCSIFIMTSYTVCVLIILWMMSTTSPAPFSNCSIEESYPGHTSSLPQHTVSTECQKLQKMPLIKGLSQINGTAVNATDCSNSLTLTLIYDRDFQYPVSYSNDPYICKSSQKSAASKDRVETNKQTNKQTDGHNQSRVTLHTNTVGNHITQKSHCQFYFTGTLLV